MPPFDPELFDEINEDAAVLFSYPAMIYPELSERTKYVIINTYHSGTLNTRSDSAVRFFGTAKAKGIPVFATGISEGPQYESAESFRKLGITPVVACSPVAAYVKLWLAHKAGLDKEATMKISLSGDLII
jgi:L-asparaginase